MRIKGPPFSSGDDLGTGLIQATIGGGKRSSAATSYLGPKFINRPNLHVLLNARVTRVINTNTKGARLAFNAVEFSQEINGLFSFFNGICVYLPGH